MITYSFTDIGSDSLYEHLYKCIKTDILEGKFPPDFKLPSKRSFAKNLGISTITIENAYTQLMAEGYIYSAPKKGYFVSGLKNLVNKDNSKSAQKCIAPLQSDSFFADFLSNRVNSRLFPFSIWARLMREVISEKSEALLTPSPVGGVLDLRIAIADHLCQFRDIRVEPEQIVIGAGTEYLYGLLIQLLGRDKVFALEDPGYKKIAQIYASNGVDCKYIPLDSAGICIDKLTEEKADIVHISPSHHYPTGIITPISRRYELLGWALKDKSRYIIEDDYDCEFRLLGKPIPALQSIDVMEKVIFMNTFTKSLASTIRISYMVLPMHLLQQFYERLGFYSCTVSNFEQYTLAKFISEGYFEKHINRMRGYYRNQRDILLSIIKQSPLSRTIKIEEENSGLHFLMSVKTNFSDEEMIRRAHQLGVRISCLSQYYHTQNTTKENVMVINYSGIEKERMDEAINRLSQCL